METFIQLKGVLASRLTRSACHHHGPEGVRPLSYLGSCCGRSRLIDSSTDAGNSDSLLAQQQLD
jgi:hypothetical protein